MATDLYLKVEPRRRRLMVEGRRVISVFTDLMCTEYIIRYIHTINKQSFDR